MRRDDVFAESGKPFSGPLARQWRLTVARRSYALKYMPAAASPGETATIEAFAAALAPRLDGIDLAMMVGAACEAGEGATPEVAARWEGLIDRLCRFSPSDEERMDSVVPGLSAMVAPLIAAYRKDDDALSVALPASFKILAGYESILSDKRMAKSQRETVRGLIAFGYLMDATAFAITGHSKQAGDAIGMVRNHLGKASLLADDPFFAAVAAQMSWVLAKAGLKAEALAQMRDTLRRVDRQGNMGVAGQVSAISWCIETLAIIRR
ncbi:MAG: hypothetical protein IPJ18_05190 [Betaproteobacteria bacterium]|nr:hypothetical protein [Betaproteobacteria bacterium]